MWSLDLSLIDRPRHIIWDFMTSARARSNPSHTDYNLEENRSSVGPLSPLSSLGHPGNSQSTKLSCIYKQTPALDVGEMHHKWHAKF